MHPFAAINMIAQRSFSKNNTSSYLFYETTKSYNFRTLESLFEQGSVFSFVVGEGGDYQDGKVNPMIANLHQVEKNEIISNNDILTNTKLGIYSSKMIVHDIYNKNFNFIPKQVADEVFCYYFGQKDKKKTLYYYLVEASAVGMCNDLLLTVTYVVACLFVTARAGKVHTITIALLRLCSQLDDL